MVKRILVALEDESYGMSLAMKFYAELDDNVFIILITDLEYLKAYVNGGFANDNIIIVGSEFYYQDINFSVFENIIILSEEESELSALEATTIHINKYQGMNFIYESIIGRTSLKQIVKSNNIKPTSVISVYSPVGGSGKTTVAYGISYALTKAYKKVLYVNMEELQAFGYLFENAEYMDRDMEKKISQEDGELSLYTDRITRKWVFDYVPPTRMPMPALGLTKKNYIHMIEEFKNTNEYDYIVVDMTSNFSVDEATMISHSNKTVCVVMQDESSMFRMRRLVESMDTSDASKFLFLCNKYGQTNNTQLKDIDEQGVYHIKEYIDYIPELARKSIITENQIKRFEQIALLCM